MQLIYAVKAQNYVFGRTDAICPYSYSSDKQEVRVLIYRALPLVLPCTALYCPVQLSLSPEKRETMCQFQATKSNLLRRATAVSDENDVPVRHNIIIL